MALGTLIKKNFKLLLRAKSSSLIVILGPLLVIFLVGVAFDNANTYSLNIGVYSDAYNELSNSFVEVLKEKQFNVEKFSSSDECINRIKSGTIHTCIVFPPNMKISNDLANEIVLNVDYSKINLVWMIIDSLKSKVASKSAEISEDLTEVLLRKLDETRIEIYNKNPIMEDLKGKNQNLVGKTTSILNELDGMDLSLDLNSLGVSTLKSSVQNQQTSFNQIDNNIKLILAKVDDIKDELEILNSSEFSDVLTYLEIIEASAGSISNTTDSNESWSSINSLVTSIDSNLQTLKGRLDSATDKREDIGNELVSVTTLLSDSKTQLDEVQSALNRIDASISGIEVTKASTIASPIQTKINPVTPEKTHLNYIFPGLIVLVIMFISILLSSTLVMMEKHSPAYFRNLITPVRYITFFFGTYLTNLITVLLQVTIILAISTIFFKAQILENIWVIAAILVTSTTMFIFIGMFIGQIFKSEETSTLASISVGSIFLLLSDIIIPLESMPSYVLNIARFNPFVIAETALKRAIMFGADFKVLSEDFYFMLIVVAIFFILLYVTNMFSEKKYLHKFVYRVHKGKLQKNIVKAKSLEKKAEQKKEEQKKENKKFININLKKKK